MISDLRDGHKMSSGMKYMLHSYLDAKITVGVNKRNKYKLYTPQITFILSI